MAGRLILNGQLKLLVLMKNSSRYDLVTGKVTVVTTRELQHEEQMTTMIKHDIGTCDYECRYTEPYGWVPECGCTVHDL